MALDFPTSPTNGQIYTDGGQSWVFASTPSPGVWNRVEDEPTATAYAAVFNAGTEDASAASTDKIAVTSPAGGWMALSTLWTWIASLTGTVTNKRNQPRTVSSTSDANLTPVLSDGNIFYRTTQTATLAINAPTGTPVIGETIVLYIDAAGAQTLNFNATYIPFGAAFPATTTAGKTLMVTAQYNGTNWKTLTSTAV
jgi:hypothetical protein